MKYAAKTVASVSHVLKIMSLKKNQKNETPLNRFLELVAVLMPVIVLGNYGGIFLQRQKKGRRRTIKIPKFHKMS